MKKTFVLGLFCLLLVSCVTTTPASKPLYSWNNYQEEMYSYAKEENGENLKKLMKTYQNIIDKQTGSRKVIPPGICADYGYLLYKQGKKEEGLSFLNKEMVLYPESSVFVSRIIKNLENEIN